MIIVVRLLIMPKTYIRAKIIYFFSDALHLVQTVHNSLSNSGSGKGTRYEFDFRILIYIKIDYLASLIRNFL